MSFLSAGFSPSLSGAPAVRIQSDPVMPAVSAPVSTSTEGDEFHAMVESSSGVEPSGGFMSMLDGVDRSRKSAEGALIKVVETGDPSRMYDATAAMARFNLQTLVLNKMASKVGQAVDRLTNLQ